jgi:hypothetical protein
MCPDALCDPWKEVRVTSHAICLRTIHGSPQHIPMRRCVRVACQLILEGAYLGILSLICRGEGGEYRLAESANTLLAGQSIVPIRGEGRQYYPPVSWTAVSSIGCHATFIKLLCRLWGFTWHLPSCTQARGQNRDQDLPSSLMVPL